MNNKAESSKAKKRRIVTAIIVTIVILCATFGVIAGARAFASKGDNEGGGEKESTGLYTLTLNTINLSVDVNGIFVDHTFNGGEEIKLTLTRQGELTNIYEMPVKNEVDISNVADFNYSINNDIVYISFIAPNCNVIVSAGAYEPLYFLAIDANQTTLTYDNDGLTTNIETSSDCNNWEVWSSGNKTLSTTSKLYVRNTNDTLSEKSKHFKFSGIGNIKVGGNIDTLINHSFIPEYGFAYLFADFTNLKDISKLLLPTTKLAMNCYSYMFSGCSNLTSLPEGLLPATQLAKSCYSYMFRDCSNLTSLPEGLLPAMQLAEKCYSAMFYGDEALVSLSKNLLPATQLAKSCYSVMFFSCSKLNISTSGDSDHLIFTCSANGSGCCANMFWDINGDDVDIEDGKSYYWVDSI